MNIQKLLGLHSYKMRDIQINRLDVVQSVNLFHNDLNLAVYLSSEMCSLSDLSGVMGGNA